MKTKTPTITNSVTTSKSELLRAITAKNFQTHKKTKIEFPPDARIIAIVGTSGAGKSCLMRGLRYLFLLGKCYAQYGQECVLVSAQMEDDISACRMSVVDLKGKKVDDHLSIMDNRDEEGKEHGWVKMNKQLPVPFVDFTRISYLDIEDLKKTFSLNFIGQMDRCLPKDFRPSEISKIFGSISGRNRIDSAIKATNIATSRIKIKIKDYEESLESIEINLEEAEAAIPDIDPDVDDLIEAWKELCAIEELETDLRHRKKQITELEKRIALIDDAVEDLDLETMQEDILTLGRLYKLAEGLETFSEAKLSYVDSAIRGIDVLGEQLALYKDLRELGLVYTEITSEIKEEESNLFRATNTFNGIRHELRLLLRKHKICPHSLEKLPEACFKKLSMS